MEYKKINENVSDYFSENVQKLIAIFPSIVKDGYIDFDALKAELGDVPLVNTESYSINWVGKQYAQKKTGEILIGKTLKYNDTESENPESTENIYIEGDNFKVLNLLQNSYRGKIKMIYIDPPYNTGKNYIYRNDFSIDSDKYAEMTGAVDDNGEKLVANPTTYGRYHSAWLSMIYQRIKLSRNLLAKDGVFICAIDENEFASLAMLLKEVFLEEIYTHSYVSVVHNPRGQQGINFSYVNEYLIIIYPNDGKKYLADFPKEKVDARTLRDSGTESDRTDAKNCFYPFYVKDNEIIKIGDVPDSSYHPKSANVKLPDGLVEVWPMTDAGDEKKWRYSRQSVDQIRDKLVPKKGQKNIQIIYEKDEGTLRSVWSGARYDASEYGTKLLEKLFCAAPFTFPKSIYAVYDCIKAVTKDTKDAIILDFFSGSATTAHAVMQLNADDGGNRKYIMVQLPENLDDALSHASDDKVKKQIKSTIKFLDTIHKDHNLCEIGKERIRRAGAVIKKDYPDIDTGFKVFKIADTNIRWIAAESGTPGVSLEDALSSSSKDLRDFMQGWNDLDVVYEILIRQYDIPLTAKIENLQTIGKRTYSIADTIIVCLEENVTNEIIDKIAAIEPIPQKIVFRDSAFNDDITLKENAMMRLDALMQKHVSSGKQPYSVEFL